MRTLHRSPRRRGGVSGPSPFDDDGLHEDITLYTRRMYHNIVYEYIINIYLYKYEARVIIVGRKTRKAAEKKINTNKIVTKTT